MKKTLFLIYLTINALIILSTIVVLSGSLGDSLVIAHRILLGFILGVIVAIGAILIGFLISKLFDD